MVDHPPAAAAAVKAAAELTVRGGIPLAEVTMSVIACANQPPTACGLGPSVRDLMSSDVITVAPELSLRSAAELFAARHLGGAPVMTGSRVVGVISTSDILAFEASTPDAAAAMRERVEREREPSEDLPEGDDPPSAFFTDLWMDDDADVLRCVEAIGSPEWDPLAEHTVADAMSRWVVSVAPETSVVTAARLMTSSGIHRVVVLDRDRLCGILSTLDLVRAVGQGKV